VLLEELGYCVAPRRRSCRPQPPPPANGAAGTDEQRKRWLARPGGRRADGRRRHSGAGARRARRRRHRPGRRTTGRGCSAAAEAETELRRTIDFDPSLRHRAGDGERCRRMSEIVSVPPVAARLVGLSQRALEMTLEYVKQRKQSGCRVGSFQPRSPTAAPRCCCTPTSAPLDRLLRGVGRGCRAIPPRGGGPLAAAAAPPPPRGPRLGPIQAHGGIRVHVGGPTCTGSTSAARFAGRCSVRPAPSRRARSRGGAPGDGPRG